MVLRKHAIYPFTLFCQSLSLKRMEVPFVNLKVQYRTIKPEIDRAVEAVFESGQFVGGTFVQQFESSFASLLGVNHCIGVGNGTDAIFIALKSLGVALGDEIITPAFSWISSAETITLAGGKPVFADIGPDFTINPELLRSEEHTSELQSPDHLVCRLLLEKKTTHNLTL